LKLAALQGFDPRQIWYHGRPIMVSRNDYQAGLYNGDTGICLRDTQGQLRVWFDTEHGLRSFLPSALPACDSVYALTVHKSQGSEYQSIDLILPSDDSRVLSRELIYTGITRARETVRIQGSEKVLMSAIQRRIKRHSGLAEKLTDKPQ
jgi:exodeoxyribonuclease V alpha subunit